MGLCLWLFLSLTGPAEAAPKTVVRVGHFPNITHAQGVIGHGLTRSGPGWFEGRLGQGVTVQWFVYNAGPTAMEAILAGSIDLAYVGPNPAVNAHLRTRGEEIRVISGACSGGAALLVQADGRITRDADFRGKKVGTPQFGNTQDVAARAWLRSKGFQVRLTGGEVLVVPSSNADLLALFQKGDLDAVWTVEPWVTRLEREARARIYLEESALWNQTGGKYVTTHLVAGARFLRVHPALARAWIAAHLELTEWIREKPDQAKQLFNQEFKAETKRALPAAVLDGAWQRLELTHDPVRDSLITSAAAAHHLGLLRRQPDLSRLYDLRPLNEVLRSKGLSPLPE